MKNLIVCFCLALPCLFFFNGCSKHEAFPEYSGPYLGQEPPGIEPQLFLPGFISTNYINHCIAFLKEGKVCVFSIWEKGTYYLYEKNGIWIKPQKVPWQNERGATDFTAGPDDCTIYFQSGRPTGPNDEERESNMWTVGWTGDGWIEPVPLPQPANTEENSELYPSAAPDGTVYFFTGTRPDSRGAGDIYRTRFVGDGEYLEAERLDAPINTDYYEVDPFVAPDGSYLLFGSSRPGGFSLLDLYVCFRQDDGGWTHPFNTGPALNPFCTPTRMSTTPDGKYFFFPSIIPTDIPKGEKVESLNIEKWGDADIYWISTGFIDELREPYMKKKSAADVIRREYRNSGLSRAAALLNDLYSSKRDDYHFELSEFLILCGDKIAAGHFDEAEQFYAALLDVIPEEFRIKLGYSVVCIMNGRTAYGLELMKKIWSQFPDQRSEDFGIITYLLRRQSKKNDELEVLKFVTNEFPNSPFAFFYLAEAFEHYGDIEKAIENCRKALELKPDFSDAAALLKKLEAPQDSEIQNLSENRVAARVPFAYEERIFIPVRIKGSRELQMIFDTGAPNKDVGIFVPELGDELDLEFEEESVVGGGGSGKGVSVRIAKGEKVSVSGIELFSERFIVITKRRPKPFPQQDGIIGRLILDEYIVEIDFDENVLRLYDPFTFEAEEGWEALPLKMEDELPIIETTIDLGDGNDIPVTLFVDIGARVSLMIKTDSSKRIVPPEDAEEQSLGSGTQGKVFGKKGLIQKLNLGRHAIDEIEASFANSQPDPNFPPGCEGILGIEILKRFNLIFDYFNEVIYLKPNRNFSIGKRLGE